MIGSRTLIRALSRPLLSLVMLAALLGGVGLGNELWTPDEPRVAAIGRTMWRSGDWTLPRLNGEPFLEKPPFYWWVQAGIFTLAGRATAPLARLPSALFAFASVLLTYAIGRRYFTRDACLLAGLVLLSMSDFALASHWVVVDNALLFSVTGVLACFVHAENRSGRSRALLLAGMYAFAAAAFFSKGVVGLGVPVIGVATYLIWSGRLRAFTGWHLLAGGAALALLVGAWLHALWRAGGPALLDEFLIQNQLGRFFPGGVSTEWGHRRPYWYYALNAPGDWLPWTPFLVLAVVSARRNWDRLEPGWRDGLRFCAATSLSVLLALSLAGTKRSLYLLPIYPLVALAVGAWMVADVERALWERRLERAAAWLIRVCALLCVPAVYVALALLRLDAWPGSLWSAALLGAGWAALRFPRPRTRTAALASTALIACLASAHLFAALKPGLDGHKSFVPFVRELERWVPAERPLYAFQPPEATLGVIGFYTDRSVTPVDLDALRDLARGHEKSWVVVRDREGSHGPYAVLREAGVPHRVVSETRVDDSRRFRILALGGDDAAAARAGEEREP